MHETDFYLILKNKMSKKEIRKKTFSDGVRLDEVSFS
jgi:hypothetical protein